ncbi:hypothetical protein C5167_017747 [Papaver somniferum]|uniref:Uncharacterized protein n=1 Tax=Papaver somniferum TaxID=3469 RepID=A0A4Y7INL9_PAPSO|nr:hypothetical protein C5167_017747 [Papaver somniferum]
MKITSFLVDSNGRLNEEVDFEIFLKVEINLGQGEHQHVVQAVLSQIIKVLLNGIGSEYCVGRYLLMGIGSERMLHHWHWK